MTPLTYIVLSVHSRGVYDTRTYLDDCMASLEKTTQNYKMIFVDDFSDENGRMAVERHADRYPSSYLVTTHKQRWFTRAYNLGLRLVRSEWAVLLNVDTVLGDGWLDELYAIRDELAAQQHRVGLVGSEFSADEQRRYEITKEPGYVTAHCWLVNMQALFEISSARGMPGWYLDETIQKHIHIFSDNEGCYSMNRLGYTTARSFKSNVGHHGGRSWGHDLGKVFNLSLNDVND